MLCKIRNEHEVSSHYLPIAVKKGSTKFTKEVFSFFGLLA
jgi:hypothetical protein